MPYLNHAGTSWPKPSPVRIAVNAALHADPSSWPAAFEAHHRAVAAFFGVTDPSRLLLTPGCTSALSVALADVAWEAGDRVLTSGFEHHAMQRPLSQLEPRGVEVTQLRPSGALPLDLQHLRDELEAAPVRLVAISAASNVTGALLPFEEVIALARAHGARVLIDGAQVAGWLPLDLPKLGVDLFTFAGHKGPQGPWGIGGLYVSPSFRLQSPLSTCDVPVAGASLCATMPGYCDVGSVDRAALAGLAAAVAWLGEEAQKNRLTTARALTDRLAKAAVGLDAEVTLYGPEPAALRVPTLALTVRGRSAGQLSASLAERGVIASGGLQCSPSAHATLGTAQGGVLRFSFGPESTERDVDAATEALREVLRG